MAQAISTDTSVLWKTAAQCIIFISQTYLILHVTKQELTGIIKYDQMLDAKGLNCPLPVLKTKVLLNKMRPGEILYVEATDPHSVVDFEAYCARTNHDLMKVIEFDQLFKFYIRRAENPKKF